MNQPKYKIGQEDRKGVIICGNPTEEDLKVIDEWIAECRRRAKEKAKKKAQNNNRDVGIPTGLEYL